MNYGPVLGAVNWREKYTMDKDNVVYFDSKSQGGGHAIVIVGWNTKGWIIQNSWGESFGDKGRFVLPYGYGLLEARALVDYENENDCVLMKPKNNKVLNVLYKIGNFFVNLLSE